MNAAFYNREFEPIDVPQLTDEMVRNILAVVSAGLSDGIGLSILGHMNVVLAMSYALNLNENKPLPCVSPVAQQFAKEINDAPWTDNNARAKGLQRLAISILGTAPSTDDLFVKLLCSAVISTLLPEQLRKAASRKPKTERLLYLEAANRCEHEGSVAAARWAFDVGRQAGYADCINSSYIAGDPKFLSALTGNPIVFASALTYIQGPDASTWAARYASRAARNFGTAPDRLLHEFVEKVVQGLIEMETPGSQFLYLAPAATFPAEKRSRWSLLRKIF